MGSITTPAPSPSRSGLPASLAFSSKARGPYTQLMLTHIEANGNDTPAVMVEKHHRRQPRRQHC